MLRIALCAALLVPVLGQTRTETEPVIHVDANDLVVNDYCPLYELPELDPDTCLWIYEDCSSGFLWIGEGSCDLSDGGCDCDDPVAAVQLPGLDGKPSSFFATAGPRFEGQRVAGDAFLGSELPRWQVPEEFELLLDMAVNVAGKPYRIQSLIYKKTGQRLDFGYELVGVQQATLARYAKGQPRLVFGNDVLAELKIEGETRVFHLLSVGESAVPKTKKDTPLMPVPDKMVPLGNMIPSLN